MPHTLDLYEVFGADPPQLRALKQEARAGYEEAFESNFKRESDGAPARLFDLLHRYPREKVAAWQGLVNALRLPIRAHRQAGPASR